MKTRLIATLLLVLFALGILSGCMSVAARQPDAPVNPTEKSTSDVPTTANEPASTPATPPAAAPAAPKPTEPPAAEPATTAAKQLTKDEAIAIALQAAGLSKDQVTRLKATFDYDDGVPEYEVEFHHDGWEYDYEIHAESGKIRSWDKDFDD